MFTLFENSCILCVTKKVQRQNHPSRLTIIQSREMYFKCFEKTYGHRYICGNIYCTKPLTRINIKIPMILPSINFIVQFVAGNFHVYVVCSV